MGNGCKCMNSQIKDKQKMLYVDIGKNISISEAEAEGSKITSLITHSDKCLSSFDLKTSSNHKEHLLNKQTINRKRKPKTLMATAITIAVLGSENVGKTSFANRFCQNKFDKNYEHSTTDELMIKRYPLNSRFYEIRMTIHNKDIDNSDFSHNDFIIVIYDLSKPETLIYAKKLFETKLKSYVIPHENGLSNVVLIGNKSDINAIGKFDEVERYCQNNKLAFFQVSTKENKGIEEAMIKLIEAFDNDVFKFVG